MDGEKSGILKGDRYIPVAFQDADFMIRLRDPVAQSLALNALTGDNEAGAILIPTQK